MRVYSVSGFAQLKNPSRSASNDKAIQLGALRKAVDKDVEFGVLRPPSPFPSVLQLLFQSLSMAQ